jgi:head-tail adaptor
MTAGLLSERFEFAKRTDTSTNSPPGDGYGNFEGAFVTQFTSWARRRFLRGGEDVMAARLQGRQPVILTIRRSSQADLVTTDWRATDARSGTVYNIRSVEFTEDRMWIDLLVEAGVAT